MTSQSQTGSGGAAAPQSVRERVIEAAMEVIAVHGWRHADIEAVLAAAGVSERDFYGEFDGLGAVIAGGSRRLDAAMLEACDDFEPGESVRDKLFALLMARFDAAQPWREATARLVRAAPTDPRLGAVGMRALSAAATRALEAAGVNPHGFLGPGRVHTLVVSVLLPVGRVWLKDDTAEMGKTMAELDKRLGQMERLASWLGPLAGRPGAGENGQAGSGQAGRRAPAPEPAQPAPPRKPGATGKEKAPGAAKTTGSSNGSAKTSSAKRQGGKAGNGKSGSSASSKGSKGSSNGSSGGSSGGSRS